MTDELPPLLPEVPLSDAGPPDRDEHIRPAGPGDLPPAWPGEIRQPRPPHPGFWWSLLWCIGFVLGTQVPGAMVFLVILVGASILSPSVAREIQQARGTEGLMATQIGSVAMMVTFFVTEILVIFVSWLVIRLVVGREWPRRLALRRPGWAHFVIVLAAFPALVLLGDGAYALFKWLEVPSLGELLGVPDMEKMVSVFNQWPAALAVLVIGLGPGIGEELWCRGFLGRGLVGRYGWLGIVPTAFFFGLIHVDPRQGLMAMLMGLWLHFTYLTTRSLLVPMLLHFLNNSLSVVSSRIPALAQAEQQAGTIPGYVYAAAGLLLLAAGWALYRSRARLQAEDGGPPLWRPAYPGVEYPPPDSSTRIVHPRPPLVAALAVAGTLVVFVGSWVLAAGGY
jgi:membrane protease YdiL (CAAX protease family)